MIEFTAPLDLVTIFGNMLAGSSLGLSFIAIIFLGALAGRFRMPNAILLVMIALMPVIVAGYFGDFYLVVIMLLAIFVPYTIVRWISR